MSSTAIVWFRRDLRLADNPALLAAASAYDTVIPVFIHAPDEEAPWQPGAASNWWLHHSLSALSADLQKNGAPLIIRRGASIESLQTLIESTGATAVYWNRLYEPAVLKRDAELQKALNKQGITCADFNAYLLLDPGSVMNQSGNPYKVFTPFWKAARQLLEIRKPLAAPQLKAVKAQPESLTVDDLSLLPDINWYAGFEANWTPGEAQALQQLDEFVADTAAAYKDDRNRPDLTGTSRLSPHLHFGEISPHQVAWAAQAQLAATPAASTGMDVFLSEVGWREFAHHLLTHFPHTTNKPLRPDFKTFPWRQVKKNNKDYVAWCKGSTGIPMVDAGMHELWHTGWMHNRVRMVVASFLTKNQLISWRAGAAWFWDTLVDANLASNTLGWQWTAGCGADAAPFFRIFNPVTQGEKFDPHERYVRQWCPELADVPAGKAHAPWTANNAYPAPIVDLKASRAEALEVFQHAREQA
ncbi:MAG: cryptochrome/photolyase family protein [Gammaproteobacteria bacterium]